MHSHIQDIGNYAGFFIGVFLFLLKRAGMVMRAGKIRRRWDYFYANWDVILYRAAFEAIGCWMFIHYDLDKLLGHWTGFQLPFEIPANPLTCFGFGLLADFGLDWVLHSEKVPQVLREEIPTLPLSPQ